LWGAGDPRLLHYQLSSPGWQSWQAKRGYSQAGQGREKQARKKGFNPQAGVNDSDDPDQ